jgi:RNA-directed DNA polymerase
MTRRRSGGGSNHPDARKRGDKVRRLRERLGEAAKRQPGRRFHALYDRIHRSDVLWEAWKLVKRNKGAAGVDAITLAAIEEHGIETFIEELGEVLRAGRYRPQRVLRRYVPKADGKQRPLGIPTVRDRVVQAAAKLILEPIFESDFRDCSYGFRPGRSAVQALEVLRRRGTPRSGGNFVLDADIRDFFGSLDHGLLMKRVEKRVSDRRVLRLIRQWLEAKVMEDGRETAMLSGTPQGGVISPLLSNIYLSWLDEVWQDRCAQVGVLVRYADDFVVMCNTRSQVEEAERRVKWILARPSQRAMVRVRQRVKELTDRRSSGKDVRDLIAALNRVLVGWRNYFRNGNAAGKFVEVDDHVGWRLKRWMIERKGRHLKSGELRRWDRAYFEALGLTRLRGTIRYPEAA